MAEYPQRNNIKKFAIKVNIPKRKKYNINLFTGSLTSLIFLIYSSIGKSSTPIIMVNSLEILPIINPHSALVHPENAVHNVPNIIKKISSLPLK